MVDMVISILLGLSWVLSMIMAFSSGVAYKTQMDAKEWTARIAMLKGLFMQIGGKND